MSQRRILDYHAARSTKLLNDKWIRTFTPGIYYGMKITPTGSGDLKVNMTAGSLITSEGVMIEEQAANTSMPAVDPVTASNKKRIVAVVCDYDWTEYDPASADPPVATYEYVNGADQDTTIGDAAFWLTVPAIADDQTLLGYIVITHGQTSIDDEHIFQVTKVPAGSLMESDRDSMYIDDKTLMLGYGAGWDDSNEDNSDFSLITKKRIQCNASGIGGSSTDVITKSYADNSYELKGSVTGMWRPNGELGDIFYDSILSSGNVAIGKISADYKLDVAGDIQCNNLYLGDWNKKISLNATQFPGGSGSVTWSPTDDGGARDTSIGWRMTGTYSLDNSRATMDIMNMADDAADITTLRGFINTVRIGDIYPATNVLNYLWVTLRTEFDIAFHDDGSSDFMKYVFRDDRIVPFTRSTDTYDPHLGQPTHRFGDLYLSGSITSSGSSSLGSLEVTGSITSINGRINATSTAWHQIIVGSDSNEHSDICLRSGAGKFAKYIIMRGDSPDEESFIGYDGGGSFTICSKEPSNYLMAFSLYNSSDTDQAGNADRAWVTNNGGLAVRRYFQQLYQLTPAMMEEMWEGLGEGQAIFGTINWEFIPWNHHLGDHDYCMFIRTAAGYRISRIVNFDDDADYVRWYDVVKGVDFLIP